MKKILTLFLVFITVFFASCSGSGDAVMLVGENEIHFDEYRYFYLNFRADHLSAGTDYTETLKSEIEDALALKYAKTDYAKKLGISLDDDDYSDADDVMDYYIDYYGGESEFSDALAEGYLTKELFYSLYCDTLLEEKLREYEYNEYTSSFRSDDATVIEYISDNFFRAYQIAILNDAGEDYVQNYERIKKALAEIENGADFYEVMSEYNEDSAQGESGYCFAEGQLITEFEDTVKELEIGQMSGIVKSSVGYHIILRCEITEEYISENLDDLRTTYKAAMFNKLMDTIADGMNIEYTDYYGQITEQMLIDNVSKASE